MSNMIRSACAATVSTGCVAIVAQCPVESFAKKYRIISIQLEEEDIAEELLGLCIQQELPCCLYSYEHHIGQVILATLAASTAV